MRVAPRCSSGLDLRRATNLQAETSGTRRQALPILWRLKYCTIALGLAGDRNNVRVYSRRWPAAAATHPYPRLGTQAVQDFAPPHSLLDIVTDQNGSPSALGGRRDKPYSPRASVLRTRAVVAVVPSAGGQSYRTIFKDRSIAISQQRPSGRGFLFALASQIGSGGANGPPQLRRFIPCFRPVLGVRSTSSQSA